jgi:UDP-N-acetylglucosamine 4,6-dehydratase
MLAEHLFTAYNVYSIPKGTRSATVRYGNVLGSRGSVVTVWKQQMAQGKPLTLTNPEMTRFLITFPRAIQLIEDALESMEGGEVFVPRLKATSMMALASVMGADKYEIVGLRPGGEKLHETLMTEEEIKRAVLAVEDTSIIPPELFPWREEVAIMGLSVPEGEWRSDTCPRYGLEELRELCSTL